MKKSFHLNDKVFIKVEPLNWVTGTIHDICNNCYIILCDHYMNGNSNLVRITDTKNMRLLTTGAKHQ